MVDFIYQRDFHHPESSANIKGAKPTSSELGLFTAYEYSMQEQILFLGLSNGKLFYYKSKSLDQKSIFNKGKDPEITEIISETSYIILDLVEI